MAYAFNGSTQYLSTASSPITNGYPATFVAWGYPESSTANGTIFSVGNTSGGSGYRVISFSGAIANDPFQASDRDDQIPLGTGTAETGTYSVNVWQNIAGSFVSASSRFVFANGSKSAENTITVSQTGLSKIGIGVVNRTTLASYFIGRAAECAMWSATLTDDEIASLAKGFKPTRIRPQSLVFYAPLIRNLQDISRGGRTITNNNSATVADHPRVY